MSAEAQTPLPAGDLEEFAADLRAEGLKEKTIDTYVYTVERFIAPHPTKAMTDFTYEMIVGFVESYPARRRGPTASALRRWFKWATRTGRRTDDPARLLPPYEWPRSGPIQDPFTEEEIEALGALSEPDGTLMALMFETGISKGEARHLQAGNFDLDKQRLHVIEGSRGFGPRVVPLEEHLVNRIARSFVSQGVTKDDYVWPTRPGGGPLRRGKPMGDASFQKWWTRCLVASGVTYRPARMARHTCAIRWRNRGVMLDDVQRLLGHNSYYTTQQLYAAIHFDRIEERFHNALPRHVTDAIAQYEWRIGYAVNPDGSYTVILLDKDGREFKSARGDDFHDAILEAWKDVLPPSDEVRRAQ